MPQMGPMPWFFLLFSVLCLVLLSLVMIYFMNMIYFPKSGQIISKNHLWEW